MVQNSSQSGRPLGFDPERAIRSAMELFWQKGYDRVGVAELEECTGLNRSSLYNTFGSKEELFAEVLRRYAAQAARQMLRHLTDGKRGLEDIAAFCQAIAQHLTTLRGRGCLMANTMAAGQCESESIEVEVNRYVEAFLAAVRSALARAHALGEIPATAVEPAGSLLLGALLGANLLARANQPPRRIREVLNAAISHIELARLK